MLKHINYPATQKFLVSSSLISQEIGSILIILKVQTWLDANRETIGSAYDTGINGIATARSNLQWSQQRLPEFIRYFETGYVEDVIDEITDNEVTTPVATTQAPTTAVPDSANITVLSFFTLLITLAVNMVA